MAERTDRREIQRAWEHEYRAGRYQNEGSVPFVDDIVEWGRTLDLIRAPALYIGCGNGRNYIPLLHSGWHALVGVDLSGTAVHDLRARLGGVPRLIVGDIGCIDARARFGTVMGIQVFQHGSRVEVHRHIGRAMSLVRPGGLFCIRVNSTETDIEFDHDVVETSPDGSFTVRYAEGPKAGLNIHFFSDLEVRFLLAHEFSPLLGPRIVTAERKHGRGRWSQWEAIGRRDGFGHVPASTDRPNLRLESG